MGAFRGFQGTEVEALALLEVIERNCSCARDAIGSVVGLCGPHSLLQPRALIVGGPFAGLPPSAPDNQRSLDGLLTYRHLADRLKAEEFTVDGFPPDADEGDLCLP